MAARSVAIIGPSIRFEMGVFEIVVRGLSFHLSSVILSNFRRFWIPKLFLTFFPQRTAISPSQHVPVQVLGFRIHQVLADS